MATIQGSTGPLVGVTSLAWPAGSAAGMLAVCWDDTHGDVRWDRDGWALVGHKTYHKRLTAADLAAPLPVQGTNSFLIVYAAAGGMGRVRQSRFVRLKANGCGLWLGWMGPAHSSALASATYQRGSTVTDPIDGYRHGAWSRAVTTAGDYQPGAVHDAVTMWSYEILPLGAPLQPVWQATSGQAVDRTQSVGLPFAHQSSAEAGMDRFRAEIRVAAGAWQHVSATGTIVATSTEIVSTTPVVVLAAGVLAANTVYEVRVYTHDEGGWSPASGSLTFTARNPPTATVTLATAPGDVSPIVSWVTTPGLGSQRSWEVRIAPAGAGWDAAVPEWSSGVQSGAATSWSAPAWTGADNGGSYVAWVQVADDALRSVPAASTAQTVSWTPPAAPASVSASDVRPLTVTASGVPAAAVSLEWEWETPGGWQPMATTDDPDATESLVWPRAPFGVARQYRVRAVSLVDGVPLSSSWVTSAAVASTDSGAYLVSPDGPDWLAIEVDDAGPLTPLQGVGVLRGLGASFERTVRTPVSGWWGWHSVMVDTRADREVLLDWLLTRPTFWLRPNPERSFSGVLADETSALVSVRSVPTPERIAKVNLAARLVRFEWTVQA